MSLARLWPACLAAALLAAACRPSGSTPEPTLTAAPPDTPTPTAAPAKATASPTPTSTLTPTPTTAPPTPTPIPEVAEFTLLEHEFGFNFPDEPHRERGGPELLVYQGQRVRLTVINDGQTFHNIFVVRDGGEIYAEGSREANLAEPDGGTLTIEFVAHEVGEFYYICGVSGHRDAGMEGRFTVRPRPGS